MTTYTISVQQNDDGTWKAQESDDNWVNFRPSLKVGTSGSVTIDATVPDGYDYTMPTSSVSNGTGFSIAITKDGDAVTTGYFTADVSGDVGEGD